MAGELEKPFRLRNTPATLYTGEIGFTVKVSAVSDWIPARLPQRGTAYRDCTHLSKTRQADFGDYILTDIQGEGDYWYFSFSKYKTALEAATPFKDPHTQLGNHPWHPTLLKVDIVKMKMPISVNAGDKIFRGRRFQAIPTYHPAMDTGTLFILREYVTPDEPQIQQHVGPQVAPVSFPLPGANAPFSFEPCYHPAININIMREVVDVYDTVGAAVTSAVGSQGPFSFPATDPPFPTSYILYSRPTKLATGAWHTQEMEVQPPNLPPIITGR